MSRLVVLGATGSIGTQALDVARRLGIGVEAIAARRGSDELIELAEGWPGAAVVVASPTSDERARLTDRLGDRVSIGHDALEEVAGTPGVVVVNGIVGIAGLAPSVAALRAGNRLALANKESLIAGGDIVLAARDDGGGELVPVDSEHSALAQCLTGEDPASVAELVLTASGGPFRKRPLSELEEVTVVEALDHPTWDMGKRITIDSATLMNKGFEVIEAHELFAVPYDRISVVVHPQSVVHGMVRFVDGSIKAHLGTPDMHLPIQYAITHPERMPAPNAFELAELHLDFEAPDTDTFPCLALGYRAGREGGSAPAVLNAADEVAVAAFLAGQIGFTSIPVVIEHTLDAVAARSLGSVADVLAVDAEARAVAHEAIGRYC